MPQNSVPLVSADKAAASEVAAERDAELENEKSEEYRWDYEVTLDDPPPRDRPSRRVSTMTLPTFHSPRTVKFCDHYSVGKATQLRFRGTHNEKLYVLDNIVPDQQFVLTMDDDASNDTTNIRPMILSKGSFGATALRAIATLVSGFVTTVWVALCIQCLLFLLINAVGTHRPSEWLLDPPIGTLLGCLAACPLLLDMLARLLTMSWACTVDCWRGMGTHHSSLWKTNSNLGQHGEWVFLVFFFGIPLLACGIANIQDARKLSKDGTLAIEGEDEERRGWYEITMLVWAGSVWIFQIIYMELCFCNELVSCHRLLMICKNTKNLFDSIRTNLLLTQRQKYSGMRRERYTTRSPGGINYLSSPHSFSQDRTYHPVQFKYTFGTRLTKLLPSFYNQLEDKQEQEQNQEQSEEPRPRLPTDTSITSVATDELSGDALLVAEPKRNFTIDEVFGNIIISSKNSWNLERLWCTNPKRVSSVTIVEGEASVTPRQFMSRSLCIGFTMVLTVLVLVGLLASKQNEFNGNSMDKIALEFILRTPIIFVLVLLLVRVFPMVIAQCKAQGHQANKGHYLDQSESEEEEEVEDDESFHKDSNKDDNEQNEELVSVWENVRITELKEWACYATAMMEMIFFFVWPLVSLFAYGNTPVGVTFLVLGIHWVPRHYFNSSHLLQELGSIEKMDLSEVDLSAFSRSLRGGIKIPERNKKEVAKRRVTRSTLHLNFRDGQDSCAHQLKEKKKNYDLKNKTLVANLLQRVTRSRGHRNWIRFLSFCFAIFLTYYFLASNEDINTTDGKKRYSANHAVHADGFYWEPQPMMPNPTCEVKKGFSFPGEESSPTSLASYAFLSSVTYVSPEESQPVLDQYFGKGTVKDDYEFVDEYRRSTGTEAHPVEYRLFTFPNNPGYAVVGVRGSVTMWDWLVNLQLWTGAILAQIIKNINPLGYMWEPILDDVVNLIDSFQSHLLKEVSLYRYTTDFVEDLYNGFDGRRFTDIRLTGHSMGGGLAALTAAITGASAISFSGTNAMYSRQTFLPPITKEQLDTQVFNIIPENDIFSKVDKPGLLQQQIRCTGPDNSIFSCHSWFRSLCEIQYQCGSQGRPINCWCVSDFGYPKPKQSGNATWEEACAEAPKYEYLVKPPIDGTVDGDIVV